MPLQRIVQVLRDRRHKQSMTDASYWDARAKSRGGYARSVWHSETFSTAWDIRQQDLLRDEFTQVLGKLEGKKIADVGCGTGRITRFLAREGAKATGYDFSPATVDAANQETQELGLDAHFEVADATSGDLPAETGTFDGALTVGCLAVACRDLPSLDNALRGISRIVSQGGPVILLEPIHTSKFLGRVLRAPISSWIRSAERAGLRLDAIRPMGLIATRLAFASLDFPSWVVDPVFFAGERALDRVDLLDRAADYRLLRFTKLLYPLANNAPEAPAQPQSNAWRSKVIRAAVSILLLGVLIYKIPLKDVSGALEAVPVSGIVLACFVMALQQLLGVLRWRRMLSRTGETISTADLLSDTLVASAYNLLLPSAVGGDVIRAYRCGKRLSQPHRAWSTMIFERLIGIISLATISVPGIAIVPGGESLLLPTLIIVVLSVIMLMVAKAPLRWVASIAVRRAPLLASVSQGVAHDLQEPLATASARLEATAWSVAYQFMGVSILAACVIPTGNWHQVFAIYAGLPLIAIGAMIPITIAGLGVREGLFVLIFARLGVTEPTALAWALLWLGSYVILAVIGVALEWTGYRAPRARE